MCVCVRACVRACMLVARVSTSAYTGYACTLGSNIFFTYNNGCVNVLTMDVSIIL